MRNTCVFCGGDVEERVVRVVEDVDDELIIVEGVPAGVCTRCGEREFSPDTVRRLERIRLGRQGITGRRSVPVAEFDRVAA